MKAWVLHNIADIRYEDVDIPRLKKGEVLLQVKAAGICGSDIPRIYKTGAYHHPLIPGHEFSGQIVKSYDKENEHWIGKRVGVFPLIPCRICSFCQNKQYEMCRNYSYLGSRRNGGFAEYCAVPVQNLIELPENVSYETAAMLEPMAVATHSIRKILPEKSDVVVICGLGTIGLFILMLLVEMGIENIYVVGNKDFQKSNAIKLGVDEDNYCDTRFNDVNKWLKERADTVNTFFECIGKNETVNLAISATAPNGKVMLIGNPHSDIYLKKDVYWKILRNQLKVMGTWNSSFIGNEQDDWHYILNKLSNKDINPNGLISHKFSIEELESGLCIMRDKLEDYIKIVMTN